MRYSFLLLSLFLSSFASAQTDTVLQKYLATHMAEISVNTDSSLSLSPEAREIVFSCMKGKSLLVLAENTSHELELYEYLRPAIIEQLVKKNLKYVFMEQGRSVAYSLNSYLDGTYKFANNNFYSATERDRLRYLFGGKRTFEFRGIDFERGIQFNAAVNNVLYDVDVKTLHGCREFITWVKDIKNINIPADSNKKEYFFHFHDFYKTAKQRFYKDSLAIKHELPSEYQQLKYLLTNINNDLPPPWTKPVLLNYQRDNELVQNLLYEIGQPDTGAVYFLSIGLEHAQPKRRQAVHKISRKKVLKDRIVIMNEYCEHCDLDGEEAENLDMGYMKGDVLSAFSKAANKDVVLFNLSELPKEYAYIKRHGTMLVYAKKQD